jgi:cation transport regulator ChaB
MQSIYRAAYNSAEEQLGEESRAHRVAWSTVENKCEKNEKATGSRRRIVKRRCLVYAF